MEPIFLKRLGTTVACLALISAGSTRLLAGEGWIATVAEGYPTDASWACSAAGAALRWSEPSGLERPVAVDFVAACDPAFDFEGRILYFSGRRTGTEGFRIWAIDLATNEVSPLTPEGLEARLPFALPDGSIAFISHGDLYRQDAESSRVEQLTFTQGHLQSAALLPDGRILYLDHATPSGRLFTMLPDGTWSTLWPGLGDVSVRDFTILDRGRLLVLGAAEDLWLVSIDDPFATRETVSVDLGGAIQGLYRGDESGAFLVAEMGGKSEGLSTRVAALRFEPEPRLSDLALFDDKTVIAVEAASPALRSDPLPSIVKPEIETGYLFVIDVARTDDPELVGLNREEIAELRIYRLEEGGSKTALFAVEPASDGSVYVEAPADTPLTLEMVDRQGAVLASTRTPIWIRPNERRGCIGCHVSPAYAPPNIRPEALVQEPHRLESDGEVSP